MGTALRNIKTTVKAKRQTLRIIGEPTIIEGTRVRTYVRTYVRTHVTIPVADHAEVVSR